MAWKEEIRLIKKTIFSSVKFNSNIERKESKNNIFATIGSVVQLDRISDFGSDGWGFESLRSLKRNTPDFESAFRFFTIGNN